ncbi:rCG51211 [Rattus norvegicus]|uniref:RCG51211 n=1 Tax=Rattus norvegicus TaxID=10116 RepID=A6IZQ5_RAT|nr:rCG51211 [Rattus norvegicus]
MQNPVCSAKPSLPGLSHSCGMTNEEIQTPRLLWIHSCSQECQSRPWKPTSSGREVFSHGLQGSLESPLPTHNPPLQYVSHSNTVTSHDKPESL